jgi:hypothetical protein
MDDTTGDPRPVSDVDKLVSDVVSRLRRLYLTTVAGFAVLLAAAVTAGTIVIVNQGNELRASCGVWGSLATLPVTPAAPTKHPSRLGVGIVLSTRYAYQGQGCGELPPADPSLVAGARYYHLPVP